MTTKTVIDSKALLGALRKMKSAIPSKPRIPILENFKILNKSIVATKETLTIEQFLPIECEAPFSLPYADVCGFLAESVGDVTLAPELIVSGEDNFEIGATADIDTFPAYDNVIENAHTTIKISAPIATALKKALLFVNKSELYSDSVANICVRLADQVLTVMATDMQLCFYEEFPNSSEADFKILINNQAIEAIAEETPYTVYISEKKICFESKDGRVIGMLAEGRFPDFAQIYDLKREIKMEFPRFELETALRKVSFFAPWPVCEFNVKNDSIDLQVAEASVNKKGKAKIVKENKTPFGPFTLNADFLLKILSAFSEKVDTVTFSTDGTTQPFLISAKFTSLKMVIAQFRNS